jgi:hypothetical protein
MKITHKQAWMLFLSTLLLLPTLLYFIGCWIPFYGDKWVGGETGMKWDFLHGMYCTVAVIGNIILTVVTGIILFDPDFYNIDIVDEDEKKSLSVWKYIKRILIGLCLIFIIVWISGFVKEFPGVYNKSIQYQNNYKQKTQERVGFYDKLWKTYLQKNEIANINKQTFIEVSKIIMENRKDGDKISWKWVQENQQIPFVEFSKFYSDLSVFIEEQREGYYKLEVECQQIAVSNNTLLDTFPNNFYNKFLGCKHIEFQYGFLSDSTISVFDKHKENIK